MIVYYYANNFRVDTQLQRSTVRVDSITNMVARILDYGPGPPIPASPARQKANPKKLAYIQAWLGDFESEGISSKAGELTTTPVDPKEKAWLTWTHERMVATHI